GFGALMIWGLRFTIDLPLPPRPLRAVVGVLVATGGIIVSVRGLGVALFGTMEPAWLEMVRSATPYNFPVEWKVRDWLNATLSLGVAFSAARLLRRQSPEYARFLLVVGLAGTLGLTATLVASQAPYLLLFQGQPYRV